MKNLSCAVLTLTVLSCFAGRAHADPASYDLGDQIKMTADSKEIKSFEGNSDELLISNPRIAIVGGKAGGYDLSVYTSLKKLCKGLGYDGLAAYTQKQITSGEEYAAIIKSSTGVKVKFSIHDVLHNSPVQVQTPRNYSFDFINSGMAVDTLTCAKKLR